MRNRQQKSFSGSIWDRKFHIEADPKSSQEAEAQNAVKFIVAHVCATINIESPRLASLDTRPKQTWIQEQPNVHNPYVAQALLEQVIAVLQEKV